MPTRCGSTVLNAPSSPSPSLGPRLCDRATRGSSTVLLALFATNGTLAWSSLLATNVTGTYSRCVVNGGAEG